MTRLKKDDENNVIWRRNEEGNERENGEMIIIKPLVSKENEEMWNGKKEYDNEGDDNEEKDTNNE